MESVLWTFRDATEWLVDQLDVPLTNRNQRLARSAVMTAYRDLPNRSRWSALERRNILQTTASQTSSTITYDHADGTYERMLTLASGTWPTDAAEGRVIISDVHYTVDERKSDTQLTLAANSNPGADVAAGTSYEWYRSTYAMPVDFRKICRIFDADNEHEIAIVGTDVHHAAAMSFYDSPDTPWQAAIRGTSDYYNSVSIEFGPPPSTARTYDYFYEAMPRQLKIEKYSTGTVSMAVGSTTVTGSSTVFPDDCVGAIMRFSSDGTSEPTPVIGSPTTSGSGLDNRAYAERVIMTRASDTSVTVDSTVSSTLTDVKYTISDPIDLNVSSMFTVFLRMAEAEFARLVNHEKLKQKELDARHALLLAMESDQLATYSRGGVRYDRFSRVSITTDSG